MPNPKIAEAGRATRFKKGNVPISPGRPKKGQLREYYQELIDKPLPEDLRIGLQLEKGATYGGAIAVGQARAAIKGKTDVAREIADRLEGKARQPVEVSGRNGGPVDLAEVISRARKRLLGKLTIGNNAEERTSGQAV